MMRMEDNGIYVAVVSAAGTPDNPAWYGTPLTAHPDLGLQDGTALLHLRAREVSGVEKQRWWVVAERFWPYYPQYRERAAGREEFPSSS